MNNTIKVIVGIVIVALVVWGVMSTRDTAKAPESAQNEASEVTVGLLSPLTGDVASYGESVKHGVELAKAALGADTVTVVYEDTQCDPAEAANAANKLISIDKAVAIVGDLCSSATLAAAPIAEQNSVVMISPASTSPDMTEAGEYIYRTIPSDALQGTFGAQLVYSRGHRRLAVLYINDDYGTGFDQVLKTAFPALGGEIVGSEAVDRDSTDVRTQITKIKSANPDAIYLISNSTAISVSALRQINELGLEAEIFASEGLKSADITEGAKEAAEGLVVSSVSSGTQEFVAQYRATYGEDPGPFAAQAYDAFAVIAKAVAQGAKTGVEIKAYLDTVTFDGASGLIEFDTFGDISGNYDVYVVLNGEFTQNN